MRIGDLSPTHRVGRTSGSATQVALASALLLVLAVSGWQLLPAHDRSEPAARATEAAHREAAGNEPEGDAPASAPASLVAHPDSSVSISDMHPVAPTWPTAEPAPPHPDPRASDGVQALTMDSVSATPPPEPHSPEASTADDPDETGATNAGDHGAVPQRELVDLNTANVDQLNALAGGGRIGQAIIRGRPYGSAEDLLRKRVLRRATYEAVRDQVTVR